VRSTPLRAPSSDRPERHEPFVNAVKRVAPRSHRWHRYRAGLLVLRFIDWLWSSQGKRMASRYRIIALRSALSNVRPMTTRVLLNRVVDLVVPGSRPQRAVLELLVRYGNRLAFEGDFDLANHVYRTVIDAARRGDVGELLPGVYEHSGSCLREQGKTDMALESYETGLRLATQRGDVHAQLRIAIAKANLQRVLGRPAEARPLLNAVIQKARVLGSPILIARACHERGVVAHAMGYHVEALGFFADAFAAFEEDRDLNRLLNDIARSLSAIGLIEVARHVWLAVFLMAPERFPRWAAGINLMALAAERGGQFAFDQYRFMLRNAPMPTRLLVAYLLEVGDGCRKFGREAEARLAYARAARLANRRGLDSEAQRAFEMLSGRPVPEEVVPKPPELPLTVRQLVETVQTLQPLPNLIGESGAWSCATLRTFLRRGRPSRSRVG
jgi:tetratricopeptide (TPR) repeat protein